MKLDEALKTLPIESIHTNTLVQLKANLEAKNIPFKYTIPPRRQVEQTLIYPNHSRKSKSVLSKLTVLVGACLLLSKLVFDFV